MSNPLLTPGDPFTGLPDAAIAPAGWAGPAPLGVRNNNPGNILAHPGVHWQGETTPDASGHVRFISPVWGIRALFMVLRSYLEYEGLGHVTPISRRWTGIRDTESLSHYVAAVFEGSRDLHPGDPVTQGNLPNVGRGIIFAENARWTYPDAVLAASWQASITGKA